MNPYVPRGTQQGGNVPNQGQQSGQQAQNRGQPTVQNTTNFQS